MHPPFDAVLEVAVRRVDIVLRPPPLAAVAPLDDKAVEARPRVKGAKVTRQLAAAFGRRRQFELVAMSREVARLLRLLLDGGCGG